MNDTIYRAIVARGNFIGQDRPDIQYTVKELSRTMSKPDRESGARAKRLGRYPVGAPRLVAKCEVQDMPEKIDVWTDTDFAGCQVTRKSTSGGVIMFGKHCLKTWSSTQEVVAVSSGEAELYGIVQGATHGLGMQSLMRDLGIEAEIHIHSDASAAIGMTRRRGVGKVRHIEVKELWVQDMVQSGKVYIHKVEGVNNIADILTKYVNRDKLLEAVYRMGFELRGGRHHLSPTV